MSQYARLPHGTQNTDGSWTLISTVNLTSGSDTPFAEARGNSGAFSDALALSLQVI